MSQNGIYGAPLTKWLCDGLLKFSHFCEGTGTNSIGTRIGTRSGDREVPTRKLLLNMAFLFQPERTLNEEGCCEFLFPLQALLPEEHSIHCTPIRTKRIRTQQQETRLSTPWAPTNTSKEYRVPRPCRPLTGTIQFRHSI